MAWFGALQLRWLRYVWGREQLRLRQQLRERDDFSWTFEESERRRRLRYVAGMDISFFSSEADPDDRRACAALVVFEVDGETGALTEVWYASDFVRMDQPYIAGFLAFREVPHLAALLLRLRSERPDLWPDVILVDGNGVLHPRGFGCASHLGVVCDACIIGVAKNLHHVDGLDRAVAKRGVEALGPGGHFPLVGASGRVWGAALLPDPPGRVALAARAAKQPVNPVFVSVGHRISLESSVRVVRQCCVSRREPEPTRVADLRSRERVRQAKALGKLAEAVTALRLEALSGEADLADLRQCLRDARSVLTTAARDPLLRAAAALLTALERQDASPSASALAGLELKRTAALAALQPGLFPARPLTPGLLRLPSTPAGAVAAAAAAAAVLAALLLARGGRARQLPAL